MNMITMNTITLALIVLSVVIGLGALLVEAVYDAYRTPRMKRVRKQEKRMTKYVVTHRGTGRFLITQATTPAAAQMRASALFGWVPSSTTVKEA